MAPRNQTKKPKTDAERQDIADFKEATKAFKKAKKEAKQQALIENRSANRQAKLARMTGKAAKAGPANVAQPEPAPQPDPQANSLSNPDVIVIDD